jgi:hypothetical protein
MTRPTDKQRWVLEDLGRGGHIERKPGRVVLVSLAGFEHTLRGSTFTALEERGWIWMAAPHEWRITTTGRLALSSWGPK